MVTVRILRIGGNRSIPTFGGFHDRRGPPAEQRDSVSTVEAVRVPGDFARRLRGGAAVRQHHPRLNRPVLCRDAADVRHVALRQRRGAQLPRSVLHHRNDLYGLV